MATVDLASVGRLTEPRATGVLHRNASFYPKAIPPWRISDINGGWGTWEG